MFSRVDYERIAYIFGKFENQLLEADDDVTVGKKKTDLPVMSNNFASIGVYFFNNSPVVALWL